MNSFYDRERELESLNDSFVRDNTSLYILYGRRRLGKTTLLRRFAEGKSGVYHMADRSTVHDGIRLLAQSMAVSMGDDAFAHPVYRTFGELFEAFDRFRPQKKSYLIIDEYQYLCEVEPALSSIIQRHWDAAWRSQPLMVVLCGSVMSMMYKETLSRSSPLFGRRTGQWLLKPMRFVDALDFFPRHSVIEQIKMHALCGGVPRYAELAASDRDFSTALTRNVLARDGALYAEAKFLLQDEVTTPNVYWSILHAVASGANRISEIAGRVGLAANQLTRYLSALSDMGLVVRHVPVTETNPQKSKRGLYRLEDAFLRLWFGCLAPFESLLEFGKIGVVQARLKDRLAGHFAWSFENICREYVEDRLEVIDGVKVGRYWDKNAEIDVVSVDHKGDVVFAGECKWSAKPISAQPGKALEEKVRNLWPRRLEKIKLGLFCPAGFTKTAHAWAKDQSAWLVDGGEICGRKRQPKEVSR